MAPVILHHLVQSRSYRIIWLLKELNVPYELKVYHRDPVTHLAPASLKELHPLGKAPMITTEDGKVIAESATITEYLISKYGGQTELAPQSPEEEFTIRHLMAHAEGSMMPLEVFLFVTNGLRNSSAIPFFIRPIARRIADGLDSGYAAPQLQLHLAYLNGLLKENGTGWFVGNHLSGADILYSFCVSSAVVLGKYDAAKYPEVDRWYLQIQERKAHKEAQAEIRECEEKPKL